MKVLRQQRPGRMSSRKRPLSCSRADSAEERAGHRDLTRGWPFITCVPPEWTGHNGKAIFYLMSWSRISCAELQKSIATFFRADRALCWGGWTGFGVDVSPHVPSLCVPMLDSLRSVCSWEGLWDTQ